MEEVRNQNPEAEVIGQKKKRRVPGVGFESLAAALIFNALNISKTWPQAADYGLAILTSDS